MNNFLGFTAALALLAACDQRPVDGAIDQPGDDTPVGEQPVVENGQVSIGDLNSANYDPDAANPLTVRVVLDGGIEQLQVYGVNPGGDFAGSEAYESYFFQDGGDSRFFRAFAAESTDGSVNAVVVSDGGQFNRSFGGATANQITYSAPDGGLVRYRGDYIGLVNFGDPAGPGPVGAVNGIPNESFAITGEVFLIADFTEGATNGEIFNRAFEPGVVIGDLPDGATLDLPEIVLVIGAINEDGSFTGSAELNEDGNFISVGSYGGLFGGEDASSVAGLVRLGTGFLGVAVSPNPDDPENPIITPVGTGNEVEYGIFVLDSTAALPTP